MPWLRAPGPALDWPDALARGADATALVCLHTAGGDTILAIDPAVVAIAGWDDLAALDDDHGVIASAIPGTPGWHPRGPGWVVQLDYDFPATPGRAWRLDAYARWSGGACTREATDAAGLDRLAAALARPAQACPAPTLAGALIPAWDAPAHAGRVERIRAWIAAGDIYQANLTLPVDGRLTPRRRR